MSCLTDDFDPPCRECAADNSGACLRETPEALRVRALRETYAALPSRWRSVFDRLCDRQPQSSAFHGFADILKFHYSQFQWTGTYRAELALRERWQYAMRCHRLRGTKLPTKDDLARDLGGLTKRHMLADLYDRTPFLALIPRSA